MTEPIVPPESTGDQYESDRSLLLREVQLLGKEVSRLRGDTKHLNEVIVPREEQKRRARANRLLVGAGFLLLALPLFGFYMQQQDINRDRAEFKQRSIEICEDRNASTRNLDALIKVLLQPQAGSAQNSLVADALERFEKSLAEVDCQTLITDD